MRLKTTNLFAAHYLSHDPHYSLGKDCKVWPEGGATAHQTKLYVPHCLLEILFIP